jgi:hypothetical protein
LVFFGFDKDFLWVEEEDDLIFRDLFFGGMVLCWLSFLFPAFDECLKVRERESFRKKKGSSKIFVCSKGNRPIG